MVVSALVLLAVAGTAFAAAQAAKPGITLQVSPASQSVTIGQPASYTVTVAATNGFAGAVALSVSSKDLPSGASASFSPTSVSLSSGGTATTKLTVTTVSSSSTGPYSLTITGTSDKVTGSVTAGLTVNAPVSSSFTMSATPASTTMEPGSTAVYTEQLSRANFPGAVSFSVQGGLPSGATATFSPGSTTGNTTTLQITTAITTADGNYSLNLVGSGSNPDGTVQYAYATVLLVISTTGKAFTISGNLPGLLAPGNSQPLNLTLTNPNNKPISVSNLTVTVKIVSRTAFAVANNQSCSTTDYAVTQYSGPYPLTVPGNGSASLSTSGVASSSWPKVAMLDRPVNQDGCKGAALTVAYAGSGQGS